MGSEDSLAFRKAAPQLPGDFEAERRLQQSGEGGDWDYRFVRSISNCSLANVLPGYAVLRAQGVSWNF